MEKIDAVNLCLHGIGASPVSTLDDENLDSNTAQFFIDRASEVLQDKGWWFNREGNWFLTPDAISGVIAVPSSVTDIISWGTSREAELGVRAGKVYDSVLHTFDLRDAVNADGKIEFVFINTLDFDDLPKIAKNAVAYLARRMFAQDVQGDETKWKMDKEDEIAAYSQLLSAESRNKKLNVFSHNADAAQITLGIGGPNGMYGMRTSSKVVFPRRRST